MLCDGMKERVDSYYGATGEEFVIGPSSIRDEATASGGSVVDSGIDSLLSVSDDSGSSAKAFRPRPVRIPPGGSVSISYTLRVEPGSTLAGRRMRFGLSDGNEFALFLIDDGVLSVSVGSPDSSSSVSAANFDEKLPNFNTLVFHEYGIAINGSRATFSVDGVCVFELSTANLSTDVLYDLVSIENVTATSGSASVRHRSSSIVSSDALGSHKQKRQRFLTNDTVAALTAFRIADASQGRTARLRSLDLYTGTQVQSYAIGLSLEEAPESLFAPPGQAIESGSAAVFGAQELSLGAGFAPAGERVRIFDALYQESPVIRRTVYASPGFPPMPANSHSTIYVSVQSLVAGPGTVILEAEFDVE